jgi:hypothetical protein
MPSVTEQEFRASLQNIQSRYIRIELLNYKYQTVDEISGTVVSGSISINANADMRRTGSIKMVIENSSFEVEPGSRIWLDKYVKVYVGTLSTITGEVIETNCGMFIIDAPSYNYDPATNTLSLTLLDLMAKLTGVRNGYIGVSLLRYEVGESIRNAIISTLALCGFTSYIVENPPAPGTFPVRLEFELGSTYYEALAAIRDIYPFYEMYFDVNGTFVYKPIPTGENDPVLVKDSLWDNIVTSEDIEVDFQNVKNYIAVYGRTHDPDSENFSTSTTLSGGNITMTLPSITSYANEVIYGFTLTNPQKINISSLRANSLVAYPVKNDDGTPAVIEAEQGEIYYCVQFKGSYWRWMGHLQAYGEAKDTNPNSPFNINGTIGTIYLPLYDGDYANCITDDLAQQRAEYELWLHTNMNNSVTLKCVPVYWLDVNTLVEYTLKKNDKTALYLIKSINIGLAPNDTMTLNMISFYPQSPNIVSV